MAAAIVAGMLLGKGASTAGGGLNGELAGESSSRSGGPPLSWKVPVGDIRSASTVQKPRGPLLTTKSFQSPRTIQTTRAIQKARPLQVLAAAEVAPSAEEEATGSWRQPGPFQRPLGRCFTGRTLVWAERGLVPIADLQPGERVLSRDEDTGATAWQEILRRFVTKAAPVLELRLANAQGAEVLEVTPGHRVRARRQGAAPGSDPEWIAAGELAPGDEVLTGDGAPTQVLGAAPREQPETVYNLEVREFHTYFVGQIGSWVHNAGCGPGDIQKPGGSGGVSWSGLIEGGLEVAGMVPGANTVANGALAVKQAADGRWGDALVSGISAVPLVGAVVKWGSKALKARRAAKALSKDPKLTPAQKRQQEMLDDDVGFNISPTSVDKYSKVGRDGTYVTDGKAVDHLFRQAGGKDELTIPLSEASKIEKDFGLNPGSLKDGFKVRRIEGLGDRSPRSPLTGNGLFQGGGQHLPGGAPEIVIDSIPTAPSPGVTTPLTVHVR